MGAFGRQRRRCVDDSWTAITLGPALGGVHYQRLREAAAWASRGRATIDTGLIGRRSGPHAVYLRPTPTTRITEPLVVVYDPSELRAVVPVPTGFPSANLLDADSLVTIHLRRGLESLFEHVSVTTNAQQASAGALLCTVRRYSGRGATRSVGHGTLCALVRRAPPGELRRSDVDHRRRPWRPQLLSRMGDIAARSPTGARRATDTHDTRPVGHPSQATLAPRARSGTSQDLPTQGTPERPHYAA
jgi:hypothetical protein